MGALGAALFAMDQVVAGASSTQKEASVS
jgi:hypothetical protein